MGIQLQFQFGADIPANTDAYVTILSDRMFKLTSNGETPVMSTY